MNSSTTTDSSTSLSIVLFYFFVGLLTICFTIYVLHKLWNEKFPPLIPIGPYSFSNNCDQKNYHKIIGLSDLYWVFFQLLFSFKQQYWTKNCGFDAFSYLYYQREMMLFLFKWFVLIGKKPNNIHLFVLRN